MKTQQETAKPKLRTAKTSDLILYGFSGVGANIPFIFIGNYLSYFYTDIFGLAPAIVSGMMLFSKIIDAIIDPFIGAMADNTRTRFGRFRPYVIFGAPFMGVCIWIMFSSPNLTPDEKVIFACVTYVLYIVVSSLVIIPCNSQANVVSGDPKQRATVQVFKQGMAIIPQLMSAVALPLVAALGDGTIGWSRYGAIMGVATCVVFWISAIGTKPYDTLDILPPAQRERQKVSLGSICRQIIDVYKNKQLRLLSGSFCLEMSVFTLSNTVNVYYFTYVLGHKDWVAATSTIALLGGLAGIVTISFLVRLFGKKRVFQVGVLASIIPNVAMLVAPNVTLAYATIFLMAYRFTSQLTNTCAWSMIPDVVDHGEMSTGVRSDGLSQSAVQLVNQIGQAIGSAVPLAIMTAVGYVANQQQTALVIGTIAFLRWGLPIIFHLLSFVCIHFYELTDEIAARNSAELDRRHAEGSK